MEILSPDSTASFCNIGLVGLHVAERADFHALTISHREDNDAFLFRVSLLHRLTFETFQ